MRNGVEQKRFVKTLATVTVYCYDRHIGDSKVTSIIDVTSITTNTNTRTLKITAIGIHDNTRKTYKFTDTRDRTYYNIINKVETR